MTKVKVAVIGLGSWGECHVEAYRSIPGVDVVAICDTRPQQLMQVGERFGIEGRYTDSMELLQRRDIDLVSVVTFEENHLASTLEALRSGMHVLVEKPVSTKLQEAKAMLEAADRHQRHVVPGHLLRFDPRYAEIYQGIQSGKIGKPKSMYFKRARTKGMFEIYNRTHTAYLSTVHDLDLAIWYASSRVKSVKAVGNWVTGADSPDILWALLQFESGAAACFNSNWMTPDQAGIVMNDSVEVIGTEGTAQFDNRGSGLELWDRNGRLTPDINIHRVMNGSAAGALRDQLHYLCECIGRGADPVYTSFQDAVHGIEVANAIVQSAATGKEIML
ncbi:Gfo/Idh/MocA family protein [Paenibacillus spongiae]|uniref:Gfo/Idh/MocA family oxidoreductase n=1 Tax=Paenibacillus spongiae TaxID=2909671 RepID=A0ABY5SGF9_9BACL|nr:Gfo/Idh/MocA family oxidoreductase [Paenibacillus spongiae]UVI31348.1 Gfo/Idh/MocA family oxidoreductase [Paenibacillus spongiae]